MKRNVILSAVFLLFLVFQGMAQDLVKTYYFEKPATSVSSDGYTTYRYQDCVNIGDEGNPLMPQYAVNLLLPPGTEITSVDIIKVEYYPEENGTTVIAPASRQFPISKGIPEGYKVVKNDKVYASKSAYPESPVAAVSTGFLSGHAMGSFSVCPIEYYPLLQKVNFIKEITVKVQTKTTEKSSKALGMLHVGKQVNKRILSLAQSSEYLSSYSSSKAASSNPTYDILLISSNELLPYFKEYVTFKKSTGYAVVCKSVEDIYNQYPGDDKQMKIRNCIIDFYQNAGIRYVILGGDADSQSSTDNIIPTRGFYGNPGDASSIDYNIPSDMYYACLDGNWNTNGDDKWGEADEADLFHEVAIGRLCVDSPAEIENVVHKLILYQTSPVVADIKKALMAGEQLDANTYGDDSKKEIVAGGLFNGYTTAGISSSFSVDKLYASEANWTKADVFNAFNNGTHLLNHLGHSNVNYNLQMYNSSVTTSNFQNDGVNHGLVISYSQGCYNGSFDNRSESAKVYGTEDCFAETFAGLSTGVVAYIANSRYGWYQSNGTNGGSQYFDRQFFDAIFGEGIYTIGDVNSDSKEDNATYIKSEGGVVRWCAYELNLFGDPTMDIWTDTPTDITATFQRIVSTGVNQLYFQTNTPNAHVGLMQKDSLIGRGITDAAGNLMINFENLIMSIDTIKVSIMAHNRNRYQSTIPVISNSPYIIYQSHQLNDASGNNNSQLDCGEKGILNLNLENLGMVASTNGTATIQTSDPFITITDNTENFNAIDTKQAISINDAFAFKIADSIPDQHTVKFKLHCESGTSSWDSYFSIVANAPILELGSLTINDSEYGNGNGKLDPGEKVNVKVTSENNGQALCKNVKGTLVSSSPYITIDETVFPISNLSAGQALQAEYTIHVDSLATTGNYSTFTYTLTDGIYKADKDYTAKTGQVAESWETGNLNRFNWQQGGNKPWTNVDSGAYEGSKCVVSGDVNNKQSSVLTLAINVSDNDTISFFERVSSEKDDYLKFYIDDVLQNKWSGETSWERVSFTVTPGNHIFKWAFEKDFYASGGSDCAWLDQIELPAPAIATAYAGRDATSCGNSIYSCKGWATNYSSLSWTTSGTGTFNNPSVLSPEYTPSHDDITAGQVRLTLNTVAIAPLTNTSDNLILTVNSEPKVPVIPEGPEFVDLYTVKLSTFTISSISNADSYSWSLTPSEAGTIITSDTAATITWETGFAGNASLTVTAINRCGESTSVIKAIMIGNTNGIDEPEIYGLEIYPNPNSGRFNVCLSTTQSEIVSIRIVNLFGIEVYHENLVVIGSVKHPINLPAPDGIYLLTIEGSQGHTVHRLIINSL